PVSARIVWFREVHPDWGVVTEPLEINHEKQYAVFRATVFNAEGKIMATATKKEDVKGFGDYLEKSETGAVGRALALCGFGTQFSPELDEVGGGRFADSPPPMGGGRYGGGNYGGNRYGNGGDNYGSGGSRFAPPREVSGPVPSRNDGPSRPDSAPRPEDGAARSAAPAPAPRPAPAPAIADEDDFEALVGADALLEPSEDDPFGEESEAPATNSAAPGASRAPAASVAPAKTDARPDGPPACVGCGKALTKAQNDLSIRNYGEALCPTCQREKPRADRAAVVAR
ncbi:MAG: hypothetical protein JO250_21975, partial [Armatimonadetes bacterium]|nr:hypothetical protein [Armatimonadota bacterium]